MPLRTANAAAAQEAEQPVPPPQRADEDSYVNPGLPLPQGVVPYSISTGIERGGQAELSGYLRSMRTQGFCCIDRVIPFDEVDAVRESVIEGYRLLKEDLPHGTWNVVERDAPGFELDENGVRPMHPPALNEICRNELFGSHLIEPRILGVAKAMLDTHVRISQTETHKGRSANAAHGRSWHSDWPHDLSSYGPNEEEPWRHCGAVRQPFPDVCMALSTVWYLGPEDVSSMNGGTWIVPKSFKDPRNPRGPDDGIDERGTIPGEMQVSCPAGSVFVQDTRSWHSNAANYTPYDRTAVVCRYVPWWLSAMEFGSGPCRTFVPKEIYNRFPPELQLLYRHLAEGVDDYLQPENQLSASRAMFQDQPHLRQPLEEGELPQNDHVQVGTMSAEEWLERNDKARL